MAALTLKSLAGSTIFEVSDAGAVASGTVTANVVGNVTGNVTGDVTGNVSGTAGALASGSTFTSTEQTGTGSAQNVAHGLGAAPRIVWWSLSESDENAFDVAPGTHTTTNAVFTVTAGVKFFVFAIK